MQNFQFPKRENSRIGKVGRITWAVNRDGARGSTTRFCRFKVHVAAGAVPAGHGSADQVACANLRGSLCDVA